MLIIKYRKVLVFVLKLSWDYWGFLPMCQKINMASMNNFWASRNYRLIKDIPLGKDISLGKPTCKCTCSTEMIPHGSTLSSEG